MKNIFFLSWPIYSHVKNSLSIVEELINLNYKVFYFGDEKFRGLIKDLDVEFIPYNVKSKLSIFGILNKEYRKINKIGKIENVDDLMELVRLQCLCKIKFYKIYSKAVEKELKRTKCDLIIHDACSYHGKIIADKFNIKSSAYLTSLLFDEKYLENDTSRALENLYRFKMDFLNDNNEKEVLEKVIKIHEEISSSQDVPLYPIAGAVDSGQENNIIFSSCKLQPQTMKKNNLICRPRIFEDKQDEKDKLKSNLVYVSTGAYLTADSKFYNSIIAAFKDTKYKVIISIPSLESSKINKIPENIEIVRQTNQAEVLKSAAVFITHGGYNGICEAIYNEVPMLVYPLTNDQYLDAQLIEDSNLGYNLKSKDINKNSIISLVEDILDDNKIKESLSIHNNSMKESRLLNESLKTFIDKLV